MTPFPVLLRGTTFASADELAAHIRDRAHHAVPRHPNDGHPVQWYLDHHTQAAGGDVETALWHASARIVRDSRDPRVLEMAVLLSGRCAYKPLYEAALRRLEGNTLPSAPGLALWFASLGLNGAVLRDSGLASRFRAYCQNHGHDEVLVGMLTSSDPNGELLQAVQGAVAGPGLAKPVVMGLGTEVARTRHGEILAFAQALAGLPTGHRERYLRQVQKWAPDWFDGNEAALRSALGL